MSHKKTFSICIIISTILCLLYVFFLFFPYFQEINKNTGAVIHVVYGYQVGFGVIGQPDVAIKGSGLILIGELGGMIGTICAVISMVLFLIKKRSGPLISFTFAMTVPCLALAFASTVLSWPLYHFSNNMSNTTPIYSLFFIINIIVTAIALIINILALIYLAIGNKKEKEASILQ